MLHQVGLSMAAWTTALRVHELPPGRGTMVTLGRTPIAVFNVDGAFHAISNACAHRGGPLAMGELRGRIVRCPLHAWEYDVTTGRSDDYENVAVPRYETRVVGDEVQVLV